MKNRNKPIMRTIPMLAMAILAAAMLVVPGGCAEEEPPPPPPDPTPPPEPEPEVDLSTIETHTKVQFPEKYKPDTQEMAESIAALANAFAMGDPQDLRDVIVSEDHIILEAIREQGLWEEQISGIQAVRVCNLRGGGDNVQVGLGIQDSEGAYLLGWSSVPDGDMYKFSSVDMQPVTAARVVALDDAPMFPHEIIPPKGYVEEVVEDDDDGSRRGSGSSSGGNTPIGIR